MMIHKQLNLQYLSRNFVRFQSSSSGSSAQSTATKKKLTLLQEQTKIPSKKTKEQELQHQQQQKKLLQQKQQQQLKSKLATKLKLKKGFNTVSKVPSTMNFEPKDILLDNLFQGYKPLILPISPVPKKRKTSSAVVYFDLEEELSYLEDEMEIKDNANAAKNSKKIDDMVGPHIHISRYIFDKNPEVEKRLKELEDTYKGSNAGKIENLFEKRSLHAKKNGRSRLLFKKKKD